MSARIAVQAVKPRRLVFGMGSRFFPNSRSSVGYWMISEILARTPSIKWLARQDLLAEVAEVGDTVYARPLVHIMEHNRVPLERLRAFLDLDVEKVSVLHYDAEQQVGKHHMTYGGRTKHNHALTTAFLALKEEGFVRVGLGVNDSVDVRPPGLMTQMFRGISDKRMEQFWLVNRIRDAHLQMMRATQVEAVATQLSGNMRAGSIYDPSTRM